MARETNYSFPSWAKQTQSTPPTLLLYTDFHITNPSPYRTAEDTLPFRLSNKNFICTSYFSNSWYKYHLFYLHLIIAIIHEEEYKLWSSYTVFSILLQLPSHFVQIFNSTTFSENPQTISFPWRDSPNVQPYQVTGKMWTLCILSTDWCKEENETFWNGQWQAIPNQCALI